MATDILTALDPVTLVPLDGLQQILDGTGQQGPAGATGPRGIQGIPGPGGPGMPVGGAAGAYMRKASATDYDTLWGAVAAADVTGALGYAPVAPTRQVLAGAGLGGGGPLSGDVVLSLPAAGTAGTYGDAGHYPVITTDPQGRVIAVALQGAASGGVTSFNARTGAVSLLAADVTGVLGYTPVNPTRQVLAGSGLAGGGTLAADVTLSLPATGTAGTYGDGTHYPVVTTDAQGRVTGVTVQAVPAQGVTSVGLTMPGVIFSAAVAGSPVTGVGTLTPTLANQAANVVLAGPTSGAATTPTFRTLVVADLPALVQSFNTRTGAITLASADVTSALGYTDIARYSGTLGYTGAFDQNTTIAGLYFGIVGGTPRMQFANGTTSQNWAIDNLTGTFRWTTPGVVQMSMTGTTLDVPNKAVTFSGTSTITVSGSGTSTITGISVLGSGAAIAATRLTVTTSSSGAVGQAIVGSASQAAELLQLHGTSSVQVRQQASIDTAWVSLTDATRKARLILRAWDTAAREVMRGEGTGTAPAVGFLGAAAVARQSGTGNTATGVAGSTGGVFADTTFTGGVGTTAYTVGDLVAALKNYGLLTQ